jgi:UDP-N-acetylglucosamine--N-acetylmuramyl-(pentapeptide) pyrophosphoryl-undecaprenol N-acetylglucosamine transferase
VNADALVARGAALMAEDGTLNDTLLPTIEQLMNDDARLNAMRVAARALARPDPALRLAHEIEALVGAGA